MHTRRIWSGGCGDMSWRPRRTERGEWKTMDGEGVAMRREGKGWRVEPGNLGVKDVKEVSLVRRCWMRERS